MKLSFHEHCLAITICKRKDNVRQRKSRTRLNVDRASKDPSHHNQSSYGTIKEFIFPDPKQDIQDKAKEIKTRFKDINISRQYSIMGECRNL